TSSSPEVTIKLGNKIFEINNKNGEAGTQYKKEYIPGEEINADVSKVNVSIKDAAKGEPTWGALYFQYFKNMNNVKNSSSPLKIERQISLDKNTPAGQELIPVNEETKLKVGDKVQVRLVVKINENLDYVHLKDIRASCMEPLQTLSGYQFQNGTGYYFTVTDAAVNYYFPHLNKGTYIFTYPVYITHSGNYTGGLSTIECLYAPQFRAHSEGVTLNIR
ncbi:MAG: alpha-2-macroglobulin family protein, partial [Chitinophagaceae bacterium]